MLVLAGIELIIFLVAGIVLCFGFGMRIMLKIRPARKEAEGAQEAGRGHRQDS